MQSHYSENVLSRGVCADIFTLIVQNCLLQLVLCSEDGGSDTFGLGITVKLNLREMKSLQVC